MKKNLDLWEKPMEKTIDCWVSPHMLTVFMEAPHVCRTDIWKRPENSDSIKVRIIIDIPEKTANITEHEFDSLAMSYGGDASVKLLRERLFGK